MKDPKSPAPTLDTDQPTGRPRGDPVRDNPSKLRELAAWYREFAERAGNPTIWEARLRMAEELDEADHIEQMKRAKLERGVSDC
jgi:hypothetical protein